MTPLRQRMIDDMQARNLSPATQKNYIHYVYELAKYFMRAPEELEPGDIKKFQLDRIGRIDITEAEYRELVDRKTASLFSACTRLGGLVAGATDTVEAELGEYAWNLGMAFQLVDDVLDFTARESILGKPVGNDLREGKVTLPLILALQQCTSGEREAVETVLRDRSYERVPLKSVIAIINKYQGIDRAREQARAYTTKARSIMARFPESPCQQALFAVTDLVTDRDH